MKLIFFINYKVVVLDIYDNSFHKRCLVTRVIVQSTPLNKPLVKKKKFIRVITKC